MNKYERKSDGKTLKNRKFVQEEDIKTWKSYGKWGTSEEKERKANSRMIDWNEKSDIRREE